MSSDPARRAASGEALRREVLERFSLDALAGRTLEVYRAAAARG
jgi:glycosyltransferase involved in cell wall biosynthesis